MIGWSLIFWDTRCPMYNPPSPAFCNAVCQPPNLRRTVVCAEAFSFRQASGCLVLGRHRKALAQLGKLFKSGAIDKTYWAVVEGSPDADEGEISLPLGRLDATRGWWMKHDPTGQPAMTRWKVMGRCSESLSWLALEPLTGRTHQIRVHCAEMGWPVLGDAIYGTAPRTRRAASASACPRNRRAALQESRADPRHRADATAHARAFDAVWLAGREPGRTECARGVLRPRGAVIASEAKQSSRVTQELMLSLRAMTFNKSSL